VRACGREARTSGGRLPVFRQRVEAIAAIPEASPFCPQTHEGDRPMCAATSTLSDAPAIPVFAARALTKVYQMGEVTVQALRGVDFDLFPREFVVLLGPPESGKSTLRNILGGLDVPTSGEVVYQDHDLTSATDAPLTEYRRTHVDFVFPFHNLIPSLTAREIVMLVTEIVEHPMTAEQALAMVGLYDVSITTAQGANGKAVGRRVCTRPTVSARFVR
jgi:putative ABC transport system ATP-binding protein